MSLWTFYLQFVYSLKRILIHFFQVLVFLERFFQSFIYLKFENKIQTLQIFIATKQWKLEALIF